MSLSVKCYQSYCSLRELSLGAIVLRVLKGASRAIVLCLLGEEYALIGEYLLCFCVFLLVKHAKHCAVWEYLPKCFLWNRATICWPEELSCAGS